MFRPLSAPRLSATFLRRGNLLAILFALLAGKAIAAEFSPVKLPSRSPGEGTALFTAMPAEATGIVVANDFKAPELWRDHYAEFAFGSLGTGVAIGDYDEDGRPDVFVVSKDGVSKLFRNRGDWKFEDVTASAGLPVSGGAWTQGASFTDVNNDRKLDLYVCRFNAPNLLFINQGDGTFVEKAAEFGVDVVDASVMGTFFDYDRDGWLDLYVQTNLLHGLAAPQGQRDHLFRNRNGTRFENVTDATRIFGATQGHSATVWDFNHDRWPDLYVANDYLTPDQLYRNVGGRGFLESIDAAVPYFPHFAMGADLGDVNDDGLLDLFVADMLPTDRDQNVRGMLNLQATMARDIPPNAAAQYMRNMLYVSTGTSRHAEAGFFAGLAATGWTWSARFEDLDEDGRVDLHTTAGMVRDFLDNDLISRMSELPFDQRRQLALAAPELRETNRAFRNLGGLRFEETGSAWGLAREGISFGAAFGDLDGDGDLDLVVSNYRDHPTVYRNNSAETNRVLIALDGTRSNRFGAGAVLELEAGGKKQVRPLHFARGYASSSEPVAHFGLGSVSRIDRLTIKWPNGATQTLSDLPANHRYLIREDPAASPESPPAETKPQFVDAGTRLGLPGAAPAETDAAEFVQQPLLPFRKQELGPGLAVADLDGDGRDDLVVGSLAGGGGLVLRNAGDRLAASAPEPFAAPTRTAHAAPLVADFDRDGRPDLFLARGGVNAAAGDEAFRLAYFRNRDGQFEDVSARALPALAVSAGPVVAADWNRDGWLDVFVGGNVVPGSYPHTPPSFLLTNRGGAFHQEPDATAPGLAAAGLVNAALWSDMDGDGWLDLLVACEWGPVRCWRNEEGRRLVEVTGSSGLGGAGSGWWRSIAAADFNGDGRIDYVVGNLGTNTRYRATAAAPLALFRTPLTPRGRPQLIEAEIIRGRLVPIRGRNQLARVMPNLPQRFPTYRQYAMASVEDVLGAGNLASAEKFAVTELRSGVFLSGPEGFTFHALPAEAQLAPVFGLVAGDFNGDGRADVYLVQNWFAPNPEVGRFSGGVSCLLLGDGLGGFTAQAAGSSGLLVPGDAKALAVFDQNSDGWPDFFVTQRNAPHRLFLNQGSRERRSLAVRLVSGVETPSPAGARITVTTLQQQKQLFEIALGSGYLSQSAPEAYFGWEPANLPLRIEVAWPDGQRSTFLWNGQRSRLVVAAPPLHR